MSQSKFFHWELEFPSVFYNSDGYGSNRAGFDAIIGNPPYGALILGGEQQYLRKKFRMGTDTARLFIKQAMAILSKQGYNGFIVPKALTFASNWEKIRSDIAPNLQMLIDVGKMWNAVRLEQVVYIIQNNTKVGSYLTGKRHQSSIHFTCKVENLTYDTFRIFVNALEPYELNLGLKIRSNTTTLQKYIKNTRGGTFQRHIKKFGTQKVLGGTQIKRFMLTGDVKGYINNSTLEKNAYVESGSLLVQRLIAHIQKPIEHIRIVATIPKFVDFVIVDTVNQIKVCSDIDPHYLLGLLNSKIINWYAYRFIFGKAVRTMEFDNPTTMKIPVIIDDTDQVVLAVKNLLEFHHNLNISQRRLYDIIKSNTSYKNKYTIKQLNTLYKIIQNDPKIINNPKLQNQLNQDFKSIQTLHNKINSETEKLNMCFYKIYKLTKNEIGIIASSVPS